MYLLYYIKIHNIYLRHYLPGTILRDRYYYYFQFHMRKLSPKEASLLDQDNTTTK